MIEEDDRKTTEEMPYLDLHGLRELWIGPLLVVAVGTAPRWQISGSWPLQTVNWFDVRDEIDLMESGCLPQVGNTINVVICKNLM